MTVRPDEVRRAAGRALDRATLTVFAAGGLVVLLDQMSKRVVRAAIPFGGEYVFIPGLIDVTHVQNRGAAFGLFPASTLFLILVSVAVCLAIVWGRAWWSAHGWLLRAAIALELGGAVGNLIDRLAYGHVTDFILFVPPLPIIGRWPAFNVADSCLTCGALLMAAILIRDEMRGKLGEPRSRA